MLFDLQEVTHDCLKYEPECRELVAETVSQDQFQDFITNILEVLICAVVTDQSHLDSLLRGKCLVL